MIASTGTEPKTERYLARVRVALRGLPEREIDDILRELRSHVDELAEKEESGVDAALQSLGDPFYLAQKYRSERPDGAGPVQRFAAHHSPRLALCHQGHVGTSHRNCALRARLLRYGDAVGWGAREASRSLSRRALCTSPAISGPSRWSSAVILLRAREQGDRNEPPAKQLTSGFTLNMIDVTLKLQTLMTKGIRSVPVVEVGEHRLVGNSTTEQLASLIALGQAPEFLQAS